MRSHFPEERTFGAGDDSLDHEQPLLVAGHLNEWWCWAPVAIAVIVTVVAVTAIALRHPLRQVLAAASVLAAVVAVFGIARRLWIRRWLICRADGFELRGRGNVAEARDSDVTHLATSRDYQHAVGRIVGEVHRLWLWTTTGHDQHPIAIVVHSALGDPSPLQPFVDRLQARLESRALEELRRDGVLTRKDWNWSEGQLSASEAGKQLTVAIAEMTAIDDDVAELRVWVSSDPLPALHISRSKADVWLLGRLLARSVGSLGDPAIAPAAGLGRILHESRPRSAAVIATLLSGFSAVVALASVFGAVALHLFPLAMLGAGTGLGSILLGSTARRLWQCVFRLHEAGVSQRGLTGDRALRFPEIDQFVFDARRQYSKGRYLGTLFTMVFASETLAGQGILHSERCAFETDELAGIRDRVSEEIATRMAKQIAATGEFTWTRELAIRGGTLHCVKRKRLGWTPAPVELAVENIRGYDISDGWFYVWSIDHERPLFRVRSSEPNFYPGLLLFEQIADKLGIGWIPEGEAQAASE